MVEKGQIVLCNFGEMDGGSPIDFVQKALRRIDWVYKNAVESRNFISFIELEKGHVLAEAMWQRVKEGGI